MQTFQRKDTLVASLKKRSPLPLAAKKKPNCGDPTGDHRDEHGRPRHGHPPRRLGARDGAATRAGEPRRRGGPRGSSSEKCLFRKRETSSSFFIWISLLATFMKGKQRKHTYSYLVYSSMGSDSLCCPLRNRLQLDGIGLVLQSNPWKWKKSRIFDKSEKLAENGFDWSLPGVNKQTRAANLQPACSCRHSCSELFYFIANVNARELRQKRCFITVFSDTTLVSTHSGTWRILSILRTIRENVTVSFKHLPLFKSRSLLRNEPIPGAELRGWTLGLVPAAQHVGARTTPCSSNVS